MKPGVLLVVLLLLACGPAQGTPPSGAVSQQPTAPPVGGGPSAAVAPSPAPPQRAALSVPGKSLAFSPYYLGVQKGLFEAEGILLDIQIVTSSNVGVAAMTAGEIPYTASSGSGVQAIVAGHQFKALMFVLKDLLFALVAAPEFGTVADLRGKTIGVSNIGASDDYAMRGMLRAYGVSPDDVTTVAAQNAATRFAALTSGALQAAVLSAPFDQQAERLGFRQLAWAADHFKRSQSGLITTDRRLQEQPDEVRRMVRATLRSIHYMLDHDEDTIAFIAREFDIAPDLARGTYERVTRALSRDGELDPEVLREEIEDQKTRMNMLADVPAAQVVDYGPVRQARRELGLAQ